MGTTPIIHEFRFSWPWAVVWTIIFAVLKLTGHIAWSWWLVFLPILVVFWNVLSH